MSYIRFVPAPPSSWRATKGAGESSAWQPPPPSFLDHAHSGRATGARYAVGMVVIVFGWVFGQAVVLVGGRAALAAPWPDLTADLLSFVPLLLVTPVVARIWLRRGWRSLITPNARVDGLRIWRGFSSWAVILMAISVPAMLVDSDGLVWGPPTWEAFLRTSVVAAALIGLQTTAEELLFRGYLIQWLSLKTRNPVPLAAISGCLFALPHLANPEVLSLSGFALLLGAVPYFVFGYAFGWVSIVSGSTELAIGAHWANNLLAVTVFGATNSVLSAPTLVTDTSPNVLVSCLAAVANCAVFAWWNVHRGRAARTHTGASP